MHFAIVLRLDVVERSSFVAECHSSGESVPRKEESWKPAGHAETFGGRGGRGQDLCQERDKNLRVKSERPM